MVSFSCDACQNVFTKPKVERHLQSCKTRSVSCIDCGVVFDSHSVRGHTSCITEEEKFGPKAGDECTQTYCGICRLKLNGAVHAVQHYDSKKHRAAIRRTREKKSVSNGEKREKDGNGRVGGANGDKKGANEDEKAVNGCKDKDADGASNEAKKIPGLTRAMKKALRGAKKQRMKRKGLVRAVSEMLGEAAPSNLESVVDRKVRKSKRFTVRRDRIMLAENTDR